MIKPSPSKAPAVPPSVDAREVEKFARLAADWWDPHGPFRPLHLFNPVRLRFIREVAARHFGRDRRQLKPFEGLSLLDIGCGGGLMSEPMARLGFRVLGADPSARNVHVAAAHAAGSELPLDYRIATAEELAEESARYDLILSLEIVEHVADIASFLQACNALLHPGGLLIVATLNRTLKSLALAKIGAEYILRWLPPGTHDWNRFVRPEELSARLEAAGLPVQGLQGIAFDPLRWEWRLSRDIGVNYMAVAVKPMNGS